MAISGFCKTELFLSENAKFRNKYFFAFLKVIESYLLFWIFMELWVFLQFLNNCQKFFGISNFLIICQFSVFSTILKHFSNFWRFFKILTIFNHFDKFSKFGRFFKFLTNFQIFDDFSKFSGFFKFWKF